MLCSRRRENLGSAEPRFFFSVLKNEEKKNRGYAQGETPRFETLIISAQQ
jgi:hypothetical protein